jgi:hypothetical protein
LSLDPPSPASVIADCLTIVAVVLDHDPSSVLISDERYIRLILWVTTVLTKVQHKSGPSLKFHHSETRNRGWDHWYRTNIPIQAQGDQCTIPICGSSGPSWTASDCQCNLVCCLKVNIWGVHAVSH